VEDVRRGRPQQGHPSALLRPAPPRPLHAMDSAAADAAAQEDDVDEEAGEPVPQDVNEERGEEAEAPPKTEEDERAGWAGRGRARRVDDVSWVSERAAATLCAACQLLLVSRRASVDALRRAVPVLLAMADSSLDALLDVEDDVLDADDPAFAIVRFMGLELALDDIVALTRSSSALLGLGVMPWVEVTRLTRAYALAGAPAAAALVAAAH